MCSYKRDLFTHKRGTQRNEKDPPPHTKDVFIQKRPLYTCKWNMKAPKRPTNAHHRCAHTKETYSHTKEVHKETKKTHHHTQKMYSYKRDLFTHARET